MKSQKEVLDAIQQAVDMNPNLTLDEIQTLAQQKIQQHNHNPNADLCGLSPAQMANWLYDPFDELAGVKICTPDDLSASPVMRYLTLILDEAMQQGGSFKATTKGNLPTSLVKQACNLLPEFAVSQYETHISISEFAGSNEDKCNALHYTRVLAEMSGIIYRRSGRYHVKKTAQKQYQHDGINAFFLPMLKTVITEYNWGYLDGWEEDIDLRTFWVFMLWRLQYHHSIDQLIEEMATAFPKLLHQFKPREYSSPIQSLSSLIEVRFLSRFLQYWGFITLAPGRFRAADEPERKADIQPLLAQTFRFEI
ncbi:MAG: SecC motif-containing protein [Oceanospirillum sp.]|nr:SecC motif-containing protein [Oceanospirillum sp.]